MSGAMMFMLSFMMMLGLASIISLAIRTIENIFSTPAHSPRSSSAHFACVDREETQNND